MTFRLEEKIFIENFNLFEFKKWLALKGGKVLFPKRIINSVYFDNNLKMYTDSVEGVTPRKKIRIRAYECEKFLYSIKFNKEIKTTFYNYRDKKVQKYYLKKNTLNNSIFDETYGICNPILNVVYERSYYQLNDVRLTIDENIKYFLVSNGIISNFGIKEKEKVVEIKSNNINAHDYLKSLLPLPRSRFSKYCRGVELLNLY